MARWMLKPSWCRQRATRDKYAAVDNIKADQLKYFVDGVLEGNPCPHRRACPTAPGCGILPAVVQAGPGYQVNWAWPATSIRTARPAKHCSRGATGTPSQKRNRGLQCQQRILSCTMPSLPGRNHAIRTKPPGASSTPRWPTISAYTFTPLATGPCRSPPTPLPLSPPANQPPTATVSPTPSWCHRKTVCA